MFSVLILWYFVIIGGISVIVRVLWLKGSLSMCARAVVAVVILRNIEVLGVLCLHLIPGFYRISVFWVLLGNIEAYYRIRINIEVCSCEI